MVELSNDDDETKHINDFLNELYKNGYFQILMFLLIEQSVMYTAVFIVFSGTFVGATVDYVCNIPKYVTSLQPIINKCSVWNMMKKKTENCEFGYVFMFPNNYVKSSIKSDFTLICDKRLLDGAAQSCVLAGFFIGGILGPLLADKYGRKNILFIGLFISGGIGITIGFINNIYMFMTGNVFLGIIREISMTTGYTFGMEFIPSKKQFFYCMITRLLWSLNMIILGVMAYFIRSWRLLQIFGSIPIILCGFLIFIVPESPKWLMFNKKNKKLQQMVEQLANKINKKKLVYNKLMLMENVYEVSNEPLLLKKNVPDYTHMYIIKSKFLLLWTLILIFSWMFVYVSYFGSSILSSGIPENKYLIFVLTSLIEIPFILITYVSLSRSRNITLLVLTLICGISFVTVGFLNNDKVVLVIVLYMLGKGCLASLFFVFISTSMYAYPIKLRYFGTGLTNSFGKFIAIIIPYFVKLYFIRTWLPTLLIGLISFFVGFINIMFPDWNNQPLPQPVEDIQELKVNIGLHYKRVTPVKKTIPNN